ncbi:uncharacterized protein [Embiotoca jacksoni]|uniref:uncharacterized protein n=1 Tax=Embiotoca jacksoni TaxID=100190 RepID=UPI0037046A57
MGTVCDDGWDLNDAKVVCRQLNCGSALQAHSSAHFGQGSGQIWLDNVECSGSEISLSECQHGGFGTHNCGHGEDAGVVCSGDKIRVVGSTLCSGRVEIYHSGVWGTVCDDNWDLNDAKVACRQASCGSALEAHSSAHFGQGSGQIWLDDVECSGSESSLSECQHGGFGTHNCGHGEDAGVICSGVQIRLSSTLCSGRVEIYHKGAWGTVCDDGWDLNDAKVVCRQLNCGSALEAHSSAHFGQGSGQIWLDNVECSGSESSLSECQHRGFGTHDCGHGEDAGVVCSVNLPKPTISMNPAGEVTWGQDVSITCSISTQSSGGTFVLTKTSGSFRKNETSSSTSATFRIRNVNFDDGGSYRCQYEKSIYNQTFRSSLSDSVPLVVSVNLPKPTISMNPAGEVTWGQVVSITCSISTQFSGGTFVLTKTSGSFRKTERSSSTSATFRIRIVNFDDDGSYRCQFEKSISSQTFRSSLSDSVPLIVSVTFGKPTISMNPAGEVTWGQNVGITCSISTQVLGGTFILTKTSDSSTKNQTSRSNSATFNLSEVDFDVEGLYQCQYQKRGPRREFISPSSDSVRLSITVNLPKPTISMNPAGEVTWGQDVSITCSISTQFSGGTFVLTKTSGSFRKTERSSSTSATFRIRNVNFDGDGSYRCQYEKSISSQTFRSSLSDSVPLVVSVNLPKPTISMNPAGEVTWGQVVSITCSISTQFSGGTFVLTKTSGSFRKTERSSSTSATFRIRNVDFDDDGSYRCQYEKSISSQTFRSSLSDSVPLVVSVTFGKPTISMNPAGEVTWGQNVGITCSISTQVLGGTFILTKTSDSSTKNQTSRSNSATFNLSEVDFDVEGLYQCQYQKRGPRREFISQSSDSVRLSITVNLPKPTISMNPAGEVTWGQVVSITCSISTQFSGGTFVLTKTSGSFRKTERSSSTSATFRIRNVDFDDDGSYRCQYEKSISSQTFRSSLSDSVPLVVSVTFGKPTISMNPAGEVTWGQNVGITCSISTQVLGGTFILTKTSDSSTKNQTSRSNSATFNLSEVDFDVEGLYQCQYQKRGPRREFISQSSDSVRLSITVNLPKPTISMNPAGEVTWGQVVSITCSISTQFSGGTFVLTKTSGSFRKTERSSSTSATFRIRNVDFDDDGSYRCQYEKSISSQTFRSSLSDSVPLVVSVTFGKPTISMNPAGEVTWGQNVGITCSISTQVLGGTFILTKTSDSSTKNQTSRSNSATFNLSEVDFDVEGLYQCQYQKRGPRREFISQSSDSVRLSITVNLPKPTISMNPAGEVTWGQDVSITCSISTQFSGGTFVLTKTSGSFRKTERSSSTSATFRIRNVDFDDDGSYRCQYEKSISSQTFRSSLSDSVPLVVSVTFGKPTISMNPAGEVTWGQNVGITCSISTQVLGGTFILTKTSDSSTKNQTSRSNSATFNLSEVDFDVEGLYQCQYQKRGPRREFISQSSDSVRLSITANLPKPTISMNPAGEVTWGQDVSITCSISTQFSGGTFVLTKTSGSFRKTERSSSTSATFRIRNVDFDDDGSYRCQYEKSISSQTFRSSLSDSVPLVVSVTFGKPTISMNPAGEVTWGQNVGITCSISTQVLGGTFILTKTSDSSTKNQTSRSNSATFNLSEVDFDVEGLYQCQYQKRGPRREFISQSSDSVRLSITANLPKPTISMNPAGEVTWGQDVSITCSISTQFSGGTFVLTKTSGSFRKTERSSSTSATFRIRNVDFDDDGSYRCQYEKSISSQTFRSSLSDSVPLVVSVTFGKPTISMNPAGEVTWGQNVGITCSISTQVLGGTFILTKTSDSSTKNQTSRSNSATFNLSEVDFDVEGLYQCQYQKRGPRREFISQSSDSVRLSITVNLPKPTISMNPAGEVTWGQDVSITCSISTQFSGGTFVLTKTSGSFRKTERSSSTSATFRIRNVDFDDDGSYRCQYEKSISSQTFRSSLSDSVPLVVSVTFGKPTISMNPAGEVTWGQNVGITCSISTQVLGGTFILTKTSDSSTKNQTSRSNSATFNLSEVDFDVEGLYQCQYQKRGPRREFISQSSDSVRLSITANLPKPTISMNPAGEVTWGQDVSITCSISTQFSGGTFVLTKTSGSFRKTERSSSTSATFRIRNVDFDDDGSYRCQYEKSISSQTFRSSLSDSVPLVVSVTFGKPTISMNPAGEVTWGQNVGITCSISTQVLGGTFILTKTSDSSTKNQTSRSNSATFNLSEVDFDVEGLYQCQYQKRGPRREFISQSSDSVRLSITANLPKPTISMNPAGEVTWGQDVSITCSISTQFSGGTFVLTKTSGSFRKTERSSSTSATFRIRNVDFDDDGSYRCQYEKSISSQTFRSSLSDSVPLVVSVTFGKPTISMNPAGEVTWGQNVGITCSISTQVLGGTFILTKTSDSSTKNQTSRSNSATFNLSEVDFDVEGLYQCQYQKRGPRREFISQSSDSVRLSITVNLPKPTISMNPAGEVTWGQDVSITCSISTQFSGGTFVLTKTSGSFRKTERSSSTSATFRIRNVDFDDDGSYRCQYEKSISSQTFRSSLSDSVPLVVSVTFGKPTISMNPAGEVTWGQNVGITCSISTQVLGGTFILTKTSDSSTKNQTSRSNSATFNLSEVDFDVEGLYQCQYQKRGPRREFISQSSDSVRLSITANLPKPTISMNPAGEVTWGQDVSITCSISTQFSGGTFVLTKTSGSFRKTERSSSTSATFRIRNVDFDDDGSYRCQYEKSISSQTFRSSLSDSVPLVVSVTFGKPTISMNPAGEVTWGQNVGITCSISTQVLGGTFILTKTSDSSTKNQTSRSNSATFNLSEVDFDVEGLYQCQYQKRGPRREFISQSSDSVRLSITANLPKPTISMNPAGEVTWGQDVSITCSISTQFSGGTFVLTKTSGSFRKTERSSSTSATFRIRNVDFDDDGSYRCQYEKSISSQTFRSSLSDSVPLVVSVTFGKPTISMNPAGEVTWGQNVGITCSISTQVLGGTFILTKTSDSSTKNQTSRSNSATFNLSEVDFDVEGLYQCQYQKRGPRREFISQSSDSVRLSITVNLPKPTISMNPAGEVTWGQDVSITCSISTQFSGGTFVLTKTSGSFRKTERSSSTSATFRIRNVDFDDDGSYRCQYEKSISSQTFRSSLSDSVPLVVSVTFGKPTISMNPAGEVTWGQNVGITCSISTQVLGGTFILTKTSDSSTKNQTSRSNSATFNLSEVDFDVEGLYQCQYQKRGPRREFISQSSDSVRLSITANLPKPTISMNPAGEVTWGQDVSITCSISTQFSGGTFVLTKTSGSFRKTERSSSTSATFRIRNVDFDDDGSYRCQYEKSISSQTFRSSLSDSVPLVVSVTFGKPTISMNPAGEVTWGQNVGITCSISTQVLGGTFILTKTSDSSTKNQTSRSNSATFNLSEVDFDVEGLYQCQYQKRGPRREFISQSSDSVRLSITANLPKPTISMNPAGEVTWGQDVSITCSISTQFSGGTFVLTKTSGSFRKTERSSSTSATFRIRNVDFDDDGSYRCQYEKSISSQTFRSSLSDSVPLVVSVTFGKPTISMNPAGEVTWGQNVGITCSISTQVLGGTFILTKTSDSSTKNQTSRSNSATFNLSEVDFDVEGLYQCQYQKRGPRREFISQSSDSVRLSITVNLPKPTISMNPAGEVTWGQDVSITCSISTQFSGGTFVLTKTSGSFRKTERSSSTSATFRIRNVDFDDDGSYRCQYEKSISSQTFRSSLSDSVPLVVSVTFGKPTISMNPAGEVTWGQNVGITCSISTQVLGGTFILTKTSDSSTKNQTARSNSATFNLSEVDFDVEGLYQCQYQKRGPRREFISQSSDSVRLSITANLPKPTISMNPAGEVTWGQDVSITCSISTQFSGGTFVLTKTSGSFRKTERSSSTSATFRIRNVDFDDDGSYRCQYEKSISSQTFRSSLSDSVPLVVSVTFGKPTISMNPAGEVTWGQNVGITCSISTQVLGGTFILTKTSDSSTKNQTSRSNSATFNLSEVDFDVEGLYQCQYQKRGPRREFISQSSDSVRLSITANLPKPTISMNPAGEVTWGQDVSITCSISTQFSGGTFVLTKTSGSFRKTERSSSTSATFRIRNVDFDDDGSYRCQYEKSISSQTFRSSLSDSVPLVVSVTFGKPTISMNPAGEVTWGQNVGITCSISTQVLGGTFILTKTSDSSTKNQTSRSNSATFNLSEVDFDVEGLYQCQYQKRGPRREFISQSSDSVRLSITVNLPKPTISMNPAGEVTWGQDVSITCSISTQFSGGTFVLTKTSGSFRKTERSSSTSATFRIRNVDFDDDGSYRCQYEKSISSQTFRSSLSDSVPLVVSVTFGKPTISMNPAGEVTWGQNVGITCSISTQVLGGTFILTKTSDSSTKNQTARSNSATFNLSEVDFDVEGLYQCQYQKRGPRREFISQSSDSVRLSITVNLPKPTISMNPAGEVTWGQDVSITCSISTQFSGGTFVLTKTSGSFRKTERSSSTSATFRIRNVDFDDDGSYRCQYEKSISSQTFRSSLSDSVPLVVSVTFGKPTISMNPAGEVTWGQNVGITCSISTQVLGGTFILTKTSDSSTKNQTSRSNSATFNLSEVDFDVEGLYKCQYQKRGPRREFISPSSDSVRLSITASLRWALAAFVGLLMILLVFSLAAFVVIAVVFRRRTPADRPGSLEQIQMDIRLWNEYENDVEDKEDKEDEGHQGKK